MSEWRFYGRRTELDALTDILHRNRWFFAKITGRRRIGKTTLVQQAIDARDSARIVYVQIRDSGDEGVRLVPKRLVEKLGSDTMRECKSSPY